jgi:hypothetical protein
MRRGAQLLTGVRFDESGHPREPQLVANLLTQNNRADLLPHSVTIVE